MPQIVCTNRLEGIGPCSPEAFEGDDLGSVLASASNKYPRLSSYLIDDQGNIRKHVAIFINGQMQDRHTVLQKHLNQEDEIHLLQALSGG
ncbi:hypothetical protein TDB9533_02022 [Thalassocella blandensis]|nr:hypothetical protein TDB9533_02022 [Thalassocella blandensis]